MSKYYYLLISTILVVGLIVCAPTAYAGGYEGDPCDSKFFGKILNDCHDTKHEHETQRDDPAAGIGADVVIWKNDGEKLKRIEEVTAEYRHDFNNGDNSIYGVVRVDGTGAVSGFFGWIKSIFKRGE
jgi:hypothetical protein